MTTLELTTSLRDAQQINRIMNDNRSFMSLYNLNQTSTNSYLLSVDDSDSDLEALYEVQNEMAEMLEELEYNVEIVKF